MTPEQCKMARAGVGLGIRELALAAGVTPETIVRLEKGETLRPRTLSAVRTALEAAGVIFIDQNGEGPGVRLRKDLGADPVERSLGKGEVDP